MSEALVWKPYQYDVAATDPYGDTLTYRFIDAHAAMLINAATGLVTCTATARSKATTRSLSRPMMVAVESEQRYTLSVIAAPPNCPPVFVTCL